MIELINVSKSYKDKLLFKNLNLKIDTCGIYLVKGESGCGKSTLLNIISGFCSYKGRVINNYKKNMSYVFQNSYLINHLTVKENLKLYKLDYSILDRFNLSKIIDNKVTTLSMGEKSRLSYIIGMYSNKDLVILDEPFSNLDKENIKILIKDILSFKDSKIIIIVSHIYLDRLTNNGGSILINKGKVNFNKDKINNKLIASNKSNIKLDLNYFNKEFKYYLKDNIKIYLVVFLTMITILFTSYLKSSFFNKIKDDTSNLVSDNKYYLSKCKKENINNITINTCFNPSKQDLVNLNYNYNYDYFLMSLFNREDLTTYNKKVNLIKGREPNNFNEVITSDKYQLDQQINLKANLLINQEKIDIYSKNINFKVVGIYNNLNFYKDNNIYFKYEYLDNYLEKEMLINNNYSLKQYYKNLEIDNYKYLTFNKSDNSNLTFINPLNSYYKGVKLVYSRSIELVNYLLFYLQVYSLYLIYRFNKNRLNLKKKTNAFLISNSFNVSKSILLSNFYDFIYLSLISALTISLSIVLKMNPLIFIIDYLILLLFFIFHSSLYFNKNKVGELMREEVW